MFIVFDSIEGAVRCAIKVQQALPEFDGNNPPDQTVRFRIGVNIGDVIPDGTDIAGDSVNILAARLPGQCPPGGIYVHRLCGIMCLTRSDSTS